MVSVATVNCVGVIIIIDVQFCSVYVKLMYVHVCNLECQDFCVHVIS